MSKEIILIKELTRITDKGQSFIQYRDEPPRDGPREGYYVLDDERYEVQNCKVETFISMNGTIERVARFAFSSEVEKEFQIIFEVINDQNQYIQDLGIQVKRLQCEIQTVSVSRDRLWVSLNGIDNMTFWQRVKFAFAGGRSKSTHA